MTTIVLTFKIFVFLLFKWGCIYTKYKKATKKTTTMYNPLLSLPFNRYHLHSFCLFLFLFSHYFLMITKFQLLSFKFIYDKVVRNIGILLQNIWNKYLHFSNVYFIFQMFLIFILFFAVLFLFLPLRVINPLILHHMVFVIVFMTPLSFFFIAFRWLFGLKMYI